MAKKDKKSSKKGREPADVVEAVRGAVERTFQATSEGSEGARDRGRSLLDDVASAAQRIRESFDDLRVLEDVKGMRTEIEALSRRVAELEKQQAARPAASTPSRSTARKTAASPSRSTARKAPAKPSAARTAARTTGAAPKPAPASRRRKAAGSS